MLQCFVCSPIPKLSEWKKGATSQSFIRKEITSYRIDTLYSAIRNLGLPNAHMQNWSLLQQNDATVTLSDD